MMISTQTTASISGVRIWLSGSNPDNATADQLERLEKFTRSLAAEAFREGARIVHGFHPVVARWLLAAAHEYKDTTGRIAPLTLLVSTEFKKHELYDGISVKEVERVCELQQIPKATDRDSSLALLRDRLASQADVLVAIGGRWWSTDRAAAGVPAEFMLAIGAGIPSFILGGLGGGATAGYLEKHPENLRNLRNGLDAAGNQSLASETDPAKLVDRVLQQIALLPLGRRETASGQRFRILCLDGGGIRGAFTAAVLAKWEQLANARVADHFDLIAGTSTGGILAIGLGLGMSAQEIVDFYRKQGPVIFPMTGMLSGLYHAMKRVAAPKFDAADLEKSLVVAYDRNGKRAYLKDSRQRLLIVSYNLTTNDLALYRTSHNPGEAGHDALPAVVVARATSAAPTYFKIAKVEEQLAPHEAVDGGVWANCPALAAVGEAVSGLKIPLSRIDVLSVGTAGLPTFVEDPALEGMAGWGLQAADLFMNAQMDATLLSMRQLLGDRFVRVDDDRPRVEKLDAIDKLDYLISRGAKIGQDMSTEVLSRFVNGVPAQPWREL